MKNMEIIIIGLLSLQLLLFFLLYTRFHSSPVQHGNLRSKVLLTGNLTKML